MANIKKFINGKWQNVVQQNATGGGIIGDDVISSVSESIESQEERIKQLERNVAWLALNGGGGFGAGGSVGGSSTSGGNSKLIVQIYNGGTPTDTESDSKVYINESSSVKVTLDTTIFSSIKWNATVLNGTKTIQTAQLSNANNFFTISYADIKKTMVNNKTSLTIVVTYEDDNNAIYANLTWNGDFTDSTIVYSYEIDALDYTTKVVDDGTAEIYYRVSVGEKSDTYKLYLRLEDTTGATNPIIKKLPILKLAESISSRFQINLKSNVFNGQDETNTVPDANTPAQTPVGSYNIISYVYSQAEGIPFEECPKSKELRQTLSLSSAGQTVFVSSSEKIRERKDLIRGDVSVLGNAELQFAVYNSEQSRFNIAGYVVKKGINDNQTIDLDESVFTTPAELEKRGTLVPLFSETDKVTKASNTLYISMQSQNWNPMPSFRTAIDKGNVNFADISEAYEICEEPSQEEYEETKYKFMQHDDEWYKLRDTYEITATEESLTLTNYAAIYLYITTSGNSPSVMKKLYIKLAVKENRELWFGSYTDGGVDQSTNKLCIFNMQAKRNFVEWENDVIPQIIDRGYEESNADTVGSVAKRQISSWSANIQRKNFNTLSGFINRGTPKLRISNGSCFVIKDLSRTIYELVERDKVWVETTETHKDLKDTLFSKVVKNSADNGDRNGKNGTLLGGWTLSICFKSDYHADEERYILWSGSQTGDGKMSTGVAIESKGVYINGVKVVQLCEETVNVVDIVACIGQRLTNITGSNDKGETIVKETNSEEQYVARIYVNGVLSYVQPLGAVKTSNGVDSGDGLGLGDIIVLGAKEKNGGTVFEGNADCDIYSLKIYKKPFTDLEILTNYINSKVDSEYVDNEPNYAFIDEEVARNLCEIDSDSVKDKNILKSLIYTSKGYTIDGLFDGTKPSETNLNTRAKNLGIPFLFFDVSTTDNWTFDNFVNATQTSKLDAVNGTVPIYYWDPNSTAQNKMIEMENTSISIQGTSTLNDVVKNLNITIPSDALFSPRVDWIPEQTYTLKADVVDSSHSNNASIGAFINKYLGRDSSEQWGSKFFGFSPIAEGRFNNSYQKDIFGKDQSGSYIYLRHTVEGFPVFVVGNFKGKGWTPLGIYSFNIGRDCYRNLGLSQITEVKYNGAQSGQTVSAFGPDKYPLYIKNVSVTEDDKLKSLWFEIGETNDVSALSNLQVGQTDIADSYKNSDSTERGKFAEGDFWQRSFGENVGILNQKFEVRHNRFNDKTHFSDVQQAVDFNDFIAQLPIEGLYSSDMEAFSSISAIVANDITGSVPLYKAKGEAPVENENLILSNDANTKANIPIDFVNAQKYFLIALLFGLVDNFGKNTTFRQWDYDDGKVNREQEKIYIDFYDLDTALGISNQGELSISPAMWLKYLYNEVDSTKSYGAVCETFDRQKALDSWTAVELQKAALQSKTQDLISSKPSANTNKLWLSIDTQFVRQNYLFKDASDAKTISGFSKHWWELRTYLDKVACSIIDPYGNQKYDNFVDFFVDEIFSKQTGNCGSLIFNFDYQLKYLNNFNNDNSFSFGSESIAKMHGRRIDYTRNWLRQHVAFLDSVFYWRDSKNYSLNSANFKNDLGSVMTNTINYTEGSLPMTFSAPLLVANTFAEKAQSTTFFPANAKIYVNSGSITQHSPVVQTTYFSPYLMSFGDDTYTFKKLELAKLETKFPSNTIVPAGLSSLTKFDASGNKSFSSSLDINIFNRTDPSQLRAINLANTSGINGATTVLNFDSRFSKMTDIDISNSTYVTSLSVPPVPLKTFNVGGSSVRNITLQDQPYITNLSFLSQCAYLEELTLINCESITEVAITANVSLKTITIKGCENLKSVNIRSCGKLETIKIEGCKNLTTVTVYSCKALKNVSEDVNGGLQIVECNAVKSLTVTDSNITDLYLKYTTPNDAKTLTKLQLSRTDVNQIITDTTTIATENKELDLRPYGIESFYMCSNNGVRVIRFRNDANKPIRITGNGNNNNKDTADCGFSFCSNLERVYGNLKICVSSTVLYAVVGAFSNCPKFSLLGRGNTAKEFKFGTAHNIVSLIPSAHNQNIWSTLGYSNDAILNLNDEGSIINPTPERYVELAWQDGDDVTNIQFDDSYNGAFSHVMHETGATPLDLYYCLFVFTFTNNRNSNGYSATWAFRNTNTNDRNPNYMTTFFSWSGSRNPDRYMFCGCQRLSNLEYFVSNQSGSLIYLLSPEEGIDNGIFSPLINLSDFNVFNISSYASRQLFRRYGSRRNVDVTTIGLPIVMVTPEDTGYTQFNQYSYRNGIYIPIDTQRRNEIGRFSKYKKVDGSYVDENGVKLEELMTEEIATNDFFGNIIINNPTYNDFVESTFIEGQDSYNLRVQDSFGLYFLDYEYLYLPKYVSSINGSFNSREATGRIDLAQIFPRGSHCDSIINGFNIITEYNSLSKPFPFLGIYNDDQGGIFKNLTKLKLVGTDNDDFINWRTGYYKYNMSQTSFNGIKKFWQGYNDGGSWNKEWKYLTGFTEKDGTKYNGILENQKETISIACGLFQSLAPEGETFKDEPWYKDSSWYAENAMDFPGSLFEGCINLTSIAMILYNTNEQIKYRLTPEGFKDCPKLLTAYKSFSGNWGNADNPTTVADNKSLIGSIPYRFFYHGLKEVVSNSYVGIVSDERFIENGGTYYAVHDTLETQPQEGAYDSVKEITTTNEDGTTSVTYLGLKEKLTLPIKMDEWSQEAIFNNTVVVRSGNTKTSYTKAATPQEIVVSNTGSIDFITDGVVERIYNALQNGTIRQSKTVTYSMVKPSGVEGVADSSYQCYVTVAVNNLANAIIEGCCDTIVIGDEKLHFKNFTLTVKDSAAFSTSNSQFSSITVQRNIALKVQINAQETRDYEIRCDVMSKDLTEDFNNALNQKIQDNPNSTDINIDFTNVLDSAGVTEDKVFSFTVEKELEEREISYPVYNTKIQNLYGCFAGVKCIQPYDYGKHEFEINDSFMTVEENAYTEQGKVVFREKSPYYMPFLFYYKNNKWVATEKVNNEMWSAYYSFNGDTSTMLPDTYYLESTARQVSEVNVPQSQFSTFVAYSDDQQISNAIKPEMYREIRYCCPPDLLRYCNYANSQTIEPASLRRVNIAALFACSGFKQNEKDVYLKLNVSGYTSGNVDDSEALNVGLHGRICPYLLLPSKEYMGLNNINYMFYGCSSITGKMCETQNKTDNVVVIPPEFFSYSNYITKLVGTFSGMIFPVGTTFSDVFTEANFLANNGRFLDIRNIFACHHFIPCDSSTAETSIRTELSGIFDGIGGKVLYPAGAFSRYWFTPMSTFELKGTIPTIEQAGGLSGLNNNPFVLRTDNNQANSCIQNPNANAVVWGNNFSKYPTSGTYGTYAVAVYYGCGRMLDNTAEGQGSKDVNILSTNGYKNYSNTK